MIRLDVEEYCQDCPAFEAKTDRSLHRSCNHAVFTDIVVSCENADRCRAIHAYLKEETKEKKNES